MEPTQEQLDKLIHTLNHRVTKLEIHVKWIKWLVGGIFLSTIANVVL